MSRSGRSTEHPEATPSVDVSAPSTAVPAGLDAGQEKVRVLLVDDLPHKLTALESILADEKLILVKAASGVEALRWLLREDFAVILLDVHMPGMDGFETASLIRQRKRSEHTPILFVTAYAPNDAGLSKGYSLGAMDYLYTPIVPEVLKAKVAAFVDLFRVDRMVKEQSRALWLYNLDLELANQSLTQRTLELQSSRESFRNVVEKNRDGIAVADSQGVLRFANPAFSSLLGAADDGVVGCQFPFPLETGALRVLEPGAWGTLRVPAELSLAETQWEGKAALLIGLRDITARRRAEEALHDSEEQLRQAQRLESIGKLAGGVAHDFNNLLTVISGYADLALNLVEDTGPLRVPLCEILKAGERAAALTHRLLAYSRKQVLIPRRLNLNMVVEDMIGMLRRLIGDNVELSSRLDPDLELVMADPGQLEQVIMNLAVNAKDAMPSGGQIIIETAMRWLDLESGVLRSHDAELAFSPGLYAELSMADTGVGMDDEVRSRIFEPFFTTKEVGKGTGLGLSMVYGFVKQSGGTVMVDSVPGQGSVFRIFLPTAAETPVRGEASRAEAETLKKSGEGATILLVDDHPEVREFLGGVLCGGGYRVLEARDGNEALDMASRHPDPIHLLVTDMIMAKMGGKDLARRLGSSRPEMKILFISGSESPGEEGAECMQKPISGDRLARKVREILDGGTQDINERRKQ